MSVKNFKVHKVLRNDIKDFIEKWHYSGSINGCVYQYCYGLYDNSKLIGAMFYGQMAMYNQWKRFSLIPHDVIELRRLCCIDDTPKNTESYFIGKSLKLLKSEWGGRIVVSYADKEYSHSGTIYKASNFDMVGEIRGARVIVYNGKIYHDRTIRTKYNGRLKPFAQKIKDALITGDALYKNTAGKYTFVYKLR